MITINGVKIIQENFGDGTLKCEALNGENILQSGNVIWWLYDNDAELFTLYCLVRDIQNRLPTAQNYLFMPYIPHARQDRNVSGRLFTLKYFAEIINSLNFYYVAVLDPHSDVSASVIDRMTYLPFENQLDYFEGMDAIMYPDAGAAKKYSRAAKLPVIVGNKCRDKDGRIASYELLNFVEGAKNVIIRDDICSYGGTFVAAAKALKFKGVENVTLMVSHCENNVIKGEVFDYVDRIITTDTICTIEHPKIEFAARYRINEGE